MDRCLPCDKWALEKYHVSIRVQACHVKATYLLFLLSYLTSWGVRIVVLVKRYAWTLCVRKAVHRRVVLSLVVQQVAVGERLVMVQSMTWRCKKSQDRCSEDKK